MVRENTSKVYSTHTSEMECISKGKVRNRYNFGVKVGVAVTNRGNFVASGLPFRAIRMVVTLPTQLS